MIDRLALIEQAFADADIDHIPEGAAQKFADYLEVLLRWNARLNLTAVRDAEAIISRHFVESVFTARQLPAKAGTLLDFGSGGGFPGLPIALTRPDIHVTLAEAHARKASFLREAVRTTNARCEVFGGRVEAMPASERFDVVTMRAVEAMEIAIPIAAARAKRYLVLLVTLASAKKYEALVPGWLWSEAVRLPHSNQMVLLVGERG